MIYPAQFNTLPDKQALKNAYKGVHIKELPTPSVVIDLVKFTDNCNRMLTNAATFGATFRPHIKTHKTLEGTALQLGTGSHKTDKIVVSTNREVWHLLPLVEAGLINDILVSLPVVKSRIEELAELSKRVPHLRLMVDHPDQIGHLKGLKWSVYVKIDMGTHRAGLVNESELLKETINAILKNPEVELFGFYCHAGHSYGAESNLNAKEILFDEIEHANSAAKLALLIDPTLKLEISVGATPTAHAAELTTYNEVESRFGPLNAKLELHAGNYCCCDLQQLATGCITEEVISITLIAEVVSTYEDRKEQLINAGVVATSREQGPITGFGKVIVPKGNWIVGRLSQEHGILVLADKLVDAKFIEYGTQIRIIPQHACITAASHPWFFILKDDVVVDIWVNGRGW